MRFSTTLANVKLHPGGRFGHPERRTMQSGGAAVVMLLAMESQLPASPVRSVKRLAAYSLIAAPFLFALPLRYWALNLAGGWFVSTDLEPDHRRAFLGLMYLGLMLCCRSL
ncbi:MAG: hypothetical protein R3C28_12220 [Pirellulaceae bacterium]